MTPPETRFKLTLHYDGSAFRGWQLQPGAPTVQGAIESALARLTGEPRTVLGSGRTDTGVHATGQVATVTVPTPWTETVRHWRRNHGGYRRKAPGREGFISKKPRNR